MADDGARVVVGAGILLLLWQWWTNSKPAMAAGGSKSGGCGCGGGSTNQVKGYTPSNPVVSRPPSFKAAAPIPVTPLDPPSVPGSNGGAAGSGAQWMGVSTRSSTPLSGPSAPSSPSAPTGSGVWQGNARPALVKGGAHV